MKPLNGIYQDSNLVDQPEGSPFYVKNAVITPKLGSINNENGFTFSGINDKVNLAINSKIPLSFIPIGIGSMKSTHVIFSTNNINSEIGVYDEDTDTYITKVYDIDNQLNFNTDYPIQMTWTANFQGDIITAWTDNNISPRVMNINNPPYPFKSSKIDIFKSFKTINSITYSVIDGGNFTGVGAFFPYYRYINYNGDVTAWIPLSYIIFTSGNSKAITITYNNIDTDFDEIEFAFYYKLGSQTFERSFSVQQITGTTLTITFTGSESFTDLIQGELSVPSLDYRTVRTMTEISKQLAMANIKSYPNLSYQKYACNIKLKWYSELLDYTQFNDNSSKLENKGYQHDEIYAFYIRFKLLNGNYSQGFIIPGLPYTDFSNTIGDVYPYDSEAKKYQILDYSTVTSVNSTHCKGTFSYWENIDEQYPKENKTNPNLEEFNGAYDYDGNPIAGGRNLLSETGASGIGKVKHFKFPNLQTTWDYYRGQGHSEYGLSKLDRLGIIVDTNSIIIPDNIKNLVQGYEIFYAERTSNNQTIFAQDYALIAARDNGDATTWGNHSTGCNFGSILDDGSSLDHLELVQKQLRNHAFDLLYNSNDAGNHFFPTIFPTHVKYNFNINSKHGFADSVGFADNTYGHNYNIPTDSYSFASRTFGGNSDTKFLNNDYLKKIKAYGYLGNNVIQQILNATGQCDNRLQEGCFMIETIDDNPFFNSSLYPTGDYDYLDVFDVTVKTLNDSPSHPSANYNLFALKSNIYNRFIDQILINTGKTFTNEIGEIIIYGGDIFLSKCCANTYGIYTTLQFDQPTNGLRGIKAWHWYIAETRNNGNYRENATIVNDASISANYKAYFDLTNFYTDNSNGNLDLVGVGEDGLNCVQDYRYTYNPTYSFTLNRFVGTVFNPNNRFSNKFPNRIIRSLVQGNDIKVLAWSFFKSGDYYDIRRNRGEITNITQTNNTKLYIHTQQALFITINKTRLATTITDVILGTGDIFEIEPEELMYENKGSLGLQHRDSVIVTPLGYFFPDAERHRYFLVKEDSIEEISSKGLRNFYLDSLNGILNDYNSVGISKIVSAYDYKFNRIITSIKNEDKSCTISYNPDLNKGRGGWLSFHDYKPDLLSNSRTKVISFKQDITGESNLYIHNEGNTKGIYYKESLNNQIPYNFIIDIVFNGYSHNEKGETVKNSGKSIFESIWFKTEFKNDIYNFLETFNYITVRNDYQCSGKITLDFSTVIGEGNIRRIKEYWKFNKFRDIVVHNTNSPNDFVNFIEDIYNDFKVIDSSLNPSMDSFEKRRFNHSYVIFRLEYDNISNSEASLIDVTDKEMESLR